ncbi:hypothetical protein EV702DRAFT_1215293 [Suillus placidus]|uniref:Uncharacterized protein n=1 Tax=Suillus placidus TaxID=48579 RepID=A0A9P6ZGL3_9AGAM|nr:hypothetical protein EV702DRAFT_1215293 [Suillus placidus]
MRFEVDIELIVRNDELDGVVNVGNSGQAFTLRIAYISPTSFSQIPAQSNHTTLKANIRPLLAAGASRSITIQLTATLKDLFAHDFPDWSTILHDVKRPLGSASGDVREVGRLSGFYFCVSISYTCQTSTKTFRPRKWHDLVPPLPRKQSRENVLPPDAPVYQHGLALRFGALVMTSVLGPFIIRHPDVKGSTRAGRTGDHQSVRDAVSPQVGRVAQDLLKLSDETDLDNLNHSMEAKLDRFQNELLPVASQLTARMMSTYRGIRSLSVTRTSHYCMVDIISPGAPPDGNSSPDGRSL